MTEPEIARRCRSCGASIRQVAHFCPQCGIELPQQNSGRTNPLFAPTLEDTMFEAATPTRETEPLKDRPSERVEDTMFEAATPRKETEPLKDGPSERVEDTMFEAARPAAETEPLKDRPKERVRNSEGPAKQSVPKISRVESGKASVGQAALGAVGAQIQRATTLARDVEGDVKHRVQRARKISSVVIDEAGYDPSLRFVLVAAVLFVLFLVIVLLNKVIT